MHQYYLTMAANGLACVQFEKKFASFVEMNIRRWFFSLCLERNRNWLKEGNGHFFYYYYLFHGVSPFLVLCVPISGWRVAGL